MEGDSLDDSQASLLLCAAMDTASSMKVILLLHV